jgi:hypothetical protein
LICFYYIWMGLLISYLPTAKLRFIYFLSQNAMTSIVFL